MSLARIAAVLCWSALALTGCSVFPDELPRQPPPLFDMQEPLDLQGDPSDEEQRRALLAGSFSGVYVSNARSSLELPMIADLALPLPKRWPRRALRSAWAPGHPP